MIWRCSPSGGGDEARCWCRRGIYVIPGPCCPDDPAALAYRDWSPSTILWLPVAWSCTPRSPSVRLSPKWHTNSVLNWWASAVLSWQCRLPTNHWEISIGWAYNRAEMCVLRCPSWVHVQQKQTNNKIHSNPHKLFKGTHMQHSIIDHTDTSQQLPSPHDTNLIKNEIY